MALLVTLDFDARPTVFGNKAIITGTITNATAASGHIAFADMLASIDAFVINGVGATPLAAPTNSIDGTDVYLASLTTGSGGDYQFMAIGNRS